MHWWNFAAAAGNRYTSPQHGHCQRQFAGTAGERLARRRRAGIRTETRPRWLGEFIGQSKAKEQLAIALEAAKSRGEALDHVLLFGPPGLGKTTLATIIANELDVGFQQTSGPALQIQGDLTAISDQPARAAGAVSGRDSPHAAGAGREALHGARGLQAGHHHRPGSGGADARDGDSAVHLYRGDDAAGTALVHRCGRGLGFCCGWSFIPKRNCA